VVQQHRLCASVNQKHSNKLAGHPHVHVLLAPGTQEAPCVYRKLSDSAHLQAAVLGVNVSSSAVRGYALAEKVSPAARLSTVMLRGDVMP
jgi:hypothetical protein